MLTVDVFIAFSQPFLIAESISTVSDRLNMFLNLFLIHFGTELHCLDFDLL